MARKYWTNKIPQRKKLKVRKIGYFAERGLIKRGKKDGKDGAVKKDSFGQYTSPYIKKELNLCLAQIMYEKEHLEMILLFLYLKASDCKQNIAKYNTKLEYFSPNCNFNITNINVEINKIKNGVVTKEFFDSLQNKQYSTRMAALQQHTSELKASVTSIEMEEERISLYLDKEIEITRLRCLQIYDYLIARLSAYWSGVLTSSIDDELPPVFNIEFDNIKNEIEDILIRGDSYVQKMEKEA